MRKRCDDLPPASSGKTRKFPVGRPPDAANLVFEPITRKPPHAARPPPPLRERIQIPRPRSDARTLRSSSMSRADRSRPYLRIRTKPRTGLNSPWQTNSFEDDSRGPLLSLTGFQPYALACWRLEAHPATRVSSNKRILARGSRKIRSRRMSLTAPTISCLARAAVSAASRQKSYSGNQPAWGFFSRTMTKGTLDSCASQVITQWA